jgi:uncharacterized protein YcfL
MKKRQLAVILCAFLIVGIAGCAHQPKTSSQSKNSLQANMQNSSSSASTKSKESSTKDLGNYQYKVPKKVVQNKHYVKNGNLTSPHQFSYDRFGTEQQLAKITSNHATLSTGSVNYQVDKVRVLKNTAKTPEAKAAAEQVLNITTIPNTYYTFVLNYTVTNKHAFQVALNGVQTVKTSTGQRLTTADQLSDSSAGNKIPAHESATFVMNGYLYNYGNKPAKTLTIDFGSIFTTNGKQVSNAPNHKMQVKLN